MRIKARAKMQPQIELSATQTEVMVELNGGRLKRGFTLIELLVVIAIIAILNHFPWPPT